MAQPCVFVVCDEDEKSTHARQTLENLGFRCETYSFSQWKENLQKSDFLSALSSAGLQLFAGMNTDAKPVNVLQFPIPQSAAFSSGSKVSTIEEMESKAIEGAIFQFRGNLTEAAKALGIGRATLYRKVKQYQLDPSAARRRRAA